MKKFKKIMALALALVMTAALAVVPANAEEETATGKIVIENAQKNVTYEIYKLFDIEEYIEDGTDDDYELDAATYTIKTDSKWYAFVNRDDIKGVYVNLTSVADSNGAKYYVDWVGTATNAAAAFAYLANEYAEDTNTEVTALATATGGDSAVVTFENLAPGYYLVDSGAGTLCLLCNVAGTTVTVTEKNSLPYVTKQVSTPHTTFASDYATACIGETLNYTLSIAAKAGAENYKLVDVAPKGITVNTGNEYSGIKVTYTPNNSTTATTLTIETDYTVTVTENSDSTTTVTVDLTKYCDAHRNDIQNADVFTVTYSASLDADATIGSAGNVNTVTLYYGADSNDDTLGDMTDVGSAKVFTYKITLVKQNNKTPADQLEGAVFKLYSDKDCTNEIPLVELTKTDSGDGVTTYYRVATDEERNAEGFEGATIVAGKVDIVGLAGGNTYYLKEITAPKGYKLPENPVTEVTITSINWSVNVTNTTTSQLPSTGGIGTTVFYTVGGILVLAALVLLVNKKRVEE